MCLLQSLTELTGCLALQNMAGLSATNKSLLVLGNQASSQQVPWRSFLELAKPLSCPEVIVEVIDCLCVFSREDAVQCVRLCPAGAGDLCGHLCHQECAQGL